MSEDGRRGPARWFFDAWSTFYDLPPVQAAVYRPMHDAVVGELRADPPDRLLDIGCGTGILTDRVDGDLEPDVTAGCDFSLGMLQQAAGKRPDLSWVAADAQRLPFADASFDAAVSTEAFHWFPDQDEALRELHRVLRRGGRLLVAMINTRTEMGSAMVNAASAAAGQPAGWPTRDEMRSRVEGAGFRVVRQRRVLRVTGLVLPPVLTVAVRD